MRERVQRSDSCESDNCESFSRQNAHDKDGRLLFEQIVKMDGRHGLQAKEFAISRNGEAVTALDRRYSQLEGREELFER